MPSTLGIVASGNFGFSPLSLSPSLWLDASDASTIISSGSPAKVSQWNDKSGNGRNVLQATSAAQPTTNVTTQNGQNVLDFDGNDFLAPLAAQFVSATNGTYSVFAAVKPSNLTVNSAGQVACLDTSTNPRRPQPLRINKATPESIAFNTSNTPFTDTGPAMTSAVFHYLSAVATTSAVEVWTNGISNGSLAVTGTLSSVTGVCTIGANSGTGAIREYLTGSLAEVIIYPTALSATDRQLVETFLKSKWGL